MATGTGKNLLEPLVLKGPAVDRDRSFKDNNDASKTDEELWVENGLRLSAEIDSIEAGFFSALSQRSPE